MFNRSFLTKLANLYRSFMTTFIYLHRHFITHPNGKKFKLLNIPIFVYRVDRKKNLEQNA